MVNLCFEHSGVNFFPPEVEFDRVVFLYHLEEGQAAASYGLNVASLAGLPKTILHTAHCKAKRLEKEVVQRSSSSSGNVARSAGLNTASEISEQCNSASLQCDSSSEQHNTASELSSLLALLKEPDVPSLSHVLRNFCYH